MSLHEDIARAKHDAPFRTALVGSLKRYRGCPACEWTGLVHSQEMARVFDDLPSVPSVPCDSCVDYRRAFLAEAG